MSKRAFAAVVAVCFALGFAAGMLTDPRTPAPDRPAADDEAATAVATAPMAAEAVPAREPETMIVPAKGRTVGEYGWHRDLVMDDWRFRDGIDILCTPGTEVLAALSGVVTEASRAASGGYLVSLKHVGDLETRYGNIRAAWVDVGQQVAAGTSLGDMGTASSAPGGVLRFAVKCGGEFMDPAVCLGQRF